MTVPSTEPIQLRAGDSCAWRREDLADYPASAWSLTYWFKNAAGGFEIVAAADGDAFAVDLAGDDTEDFAAGVYSWQARVVKIADPDERHTVASGTLEVLATLFSGTATDALDNRTVAQKAIDDLKAALATYTASQGHVAEYEIGDRRMRFASAASIRELLSFWQAERLREQRAAAIAAGRGDPRRLYTRFGRA